MRTGMIFTDTGPIVILTRFDSLANPQLLMQLEEKGIRKFVAFEVPESIAKDQYGAHYNKVMEDLKQTDDLRILDEDGRHIFTKVSLKDLRNPLIHEL